MSPPTKLIDKNVVDLSRSRSPTAHSVREFRTKLAITGPSSSAYLHDRLSLYAKSQAPMTIMLALLALTIIAFSHASLNTNTIIIGSTSTIFAAICSLLVSARFLRQTKPTKKTLRWLIAMALGQVIVCGITTAFIWHTCSTCSANELILLKFVATIGFIAIVSTTAYPFIPLSVLLIALPATSLSAHLAFGKQPGSSLELGVLAFTTAFFCYVIHVLRHSMIKRFDEATERKALMAETETQKSIANSARIRAEEANLAKSRFLATMSHELRTPLNAILGFSGMMKDEILGPIENEKYREYVDDIHSSGSHLLHVINDILDISRIEAGKHELNEEKLSLVSVVEDACRLMDVKAQEKNITLQSNLDEQLPTVWVDRKSVRQIALNLLSNAIKFTPTNGTVTIKAGWTSGGGQYLSIRDTGPGIPEDEIPVILSSFGQGSIAIHSAEQGTGLGLTIVQALLQLHQGRFELKSKLREGTEVIAFFPKERVSIPDQVRHEVQQDRKIVDALYASA